MCGAWRLGTLGNSRGLATSRQSSKSSKLKLARKPAHCSRSSCATLRPCPRVTLRLTLRRQAQPVSETFELIGRHARLARWMDNEHWFDQLGQVGKVLDQLFDAGLELRLPGDADLETE